MNYYLDKTPLDQSLGYFNGNYTKATLVNSNDEVPDQTEILLRSRVRLYVLDILRNILICITQPSITNIRSYKAIKLS